MTPLQQTHSTAIEVPSGWLPQASRRSSLCRIVVCGCATLMAFGCGGGSGTSLVTDMKSFCKDFDQMDQQFDGLGEDAPLSIADYRKISGALRKLAAEAPAAVKADLKAMADGADKAAKSGSGFIDSDAVIAASGRLATFGDDNCA
jgi:hypothetical protein